MKAPNGNQRPQVPDEQRLLTVRALATLLCWHEESVRRALRQGRLSGLKLGRDWRVLPTVAEEIMRNGIPRP